MNKSMIVLRAVLGSLLLAAVVVAGAAAAPNPFKGVWSSIDPVDGSTQWLFVGGGSGGSFHTRYYDDGATVCEDDGVLYPAQAVGALGIFQGSILGLMPVYCMASPRYLYDLDVYFEYSYDPTNDTLVDQFSTTWTRGH
jgi:hypothetical protein